MDKLILTFTPKQHEKYLQLRAKEIDALNFDTSLAEFETYSQDILKNSLSSICAECERLLTFYDSKAFFTSLSEKDTQKLIPVYFDVINNIEKQRKKLYSESIRTTKIFMNAEKLCADISKKYNDFLPYKAAFYNNEKFKNEILETDDKFLKSIEKAQAFRSDIANYLNSISIVCDEYIPEFYKKSSSASDSPKFKGFKANEFFASVITFVTQLKTI